MKTNTIIHDYTSGPVTKQLLTFAWPFMLSNLLLTAYNLVDMIIVGQFVGSVGLTAVSNGGDLVHLYTFLTMGFCSAGQIIISQYIGQKNKEAVSKTIGTLLWIVGLISVFIMAVGLVLNRLFLSWLNVPAEAFEQCLAYTNCCTTGCLFISGYNLVGSVLRGMGDSKHPMIFIGVASILNVILDLVFVSRGMGAFGAALATVISQGVSFICALVLLYRKREEFHFELRREYVVPDRKIAALLTKLGIPMLLQGCAISFSGLFVASFINGYGVTAAAVTGVGQKLSTVANIVAMALSQATATMVGQNFSAGKFNRVRKVVFDSYIIGGLTVLLLSVIIVLWPERVFSIFNSDPAVLSMSRQYVIVAVITYIGIAARSPSMAMCNGLGFASMNLTLGILDGVVVRVGLSLLLGQVLGLGIQGFWLGSAIAGMTFFVIMFPYLLSGKWKNRTPPVAE